MPYIAFVALGGGNAWVARRRGDTHDMTCDGGSTTHPIPTACKWLQLIKFNQCHYACSTVGDHLPAYLRPLLCYNSKPHVVIQYLLHNETEK